MKRTFSTLVTTWRSNTNHLNSSAVESAKVTYVAKKKELKEKYEKRTHDLEMELQHYKAKEETLENEKKANRLKIIQLEGELEEAEKTKEKDVAHIKDEVKELQLQLEEAEKKLQVIEKEKNDLQRRIQRKRDKKLPPMAPPPPEQDFAPMTPRSNDPFLTEFVLMTYYSCSSTAGQDITRGTSNNRTVEPCGTQTSRFMYVKTFLNATAFQDVDPLSREVKDDDNLLNIIAR